MNTKGKARTSAPMGAVEYRQRMVTSLELIGCWPRPDSPGPGLCRIALRREIVKGIRFLDDDALVAVMWVVNALGLPAQDVRGGAT